MYEHATNDDQLKKVRALHNGEEVEVIELTRLVEDEPDMAQASENSQDQPEFPDLPEAAGAAQAPCSEEGAVEDACADSRKTSPEDSPEAPLAGSPESFANGPAFGPVETAPWGEAAPNEAGAADEPAADEPVAGESLENAGKDIPAPASDVATDVAPDAAPDVATDAATDVATDAATAVATAVAPDVATGAAPDVATGAVDEEPVQTALARDKAIGELGERLAGLERSFAVLRDAVSVNIRVDANLRAIQERIERIENLAVDDKPVAAAFAMRLSECEERIELIAGARELAELREEVNALKARETDGGERAQAPAQAPEKLEERLEVLSQSTRRVEKKLGQRIEAVEAQAQKDEKKLAQEIKEARKTLEAVEARIKTAGKKQEEALTTLSRTLGERMDETARKLDRQAAALRDVADGRNRDEERLNGLEARVMTVDKKQEEALATLSRTLGERMDETARKLDSQATALRDVADGRNRDEERLNGLEARVGELERGLADVLSLAERVAQRVSALETQMSEDAIEKITAKACLRVLREEIVRLTAR